MNIGILLAFIVKGGGAFAALIMHVLVAKILMPNQAGQFYVAFTTITLLSVVCRLGLDEVVLKNVSIFYHEKKHWSINSLYRTSFVAVLVSSLFGFSGLLLSSYILGSLNSQYSKVIFYISPAIVFFSLYTLHAQLLQGRLESVKSTIVLNLVSQCVFSILILSIPVHSSEGAAILFNVSTGIACIVGIFLWWNTSIIQLRVRCVGWFPFWNSSRHFWVAMIIQQATIWGGQLISVGTVSSSDMAALNLFQRLTSALQFFLVFASLIYSPQMAALYAKGDLIKLQNLIFRVQRYLLLLSIIGFIAGVISIPFIASFFGESYGQHSISFVLLLAAQCINVTLGFTFFILMMCEHEIILKNITVYTFPIVLLSSPSLGYWWGAEGIAFSSLLILSVQNILASFIVKKRLNLNLFY